MIQNEASRVFASLIVSIILFYAVRNVQAKVFFEPIFLVESSKLFVWNGESFVDGTTIERYSSRFAVEL